MLIENLIFWPLYIALWAAVVRYDVHMFQHNSYRVERYGRWFRSGHKFLRAAVIAALAVLGAVIPAISFYLSGIWKKSAKNKQL